MGPFMSKYLKRSISKYQLIYSEYDNYIFFNILKVFKNDLE